MYIIAQRKGIVLLGVMMGTVMNHDKHMDHAASPINAADRKMFGPGLRLSDCFDPIRHVTNISSTHWWRNFAP